MYETEQAGRGRSVADLGDSLLLRLPGITGTAKQSGHVGEIEVTGERLQQLHRQHLGKAAVEVGQEIHLHSGAMPEVNAASMAAQLMGDRASNQAALRADLLLQLQTALNGLDSLDRELLALRHFEELSNESAAAVLGLEPAAANIHYLQALKRLNEILRSIPGFFAAQRGTGRV